MEILVVVALLSVIVLGLLAMFTQTQRAFRTGMTQSDVLAGGRLAMDLLTRELEGIAPAYEPGLNFLARMPHNNATYNRPFLQNLPGSTVWPKRTNLLHDIFFLTRRNQDLTAIGYFVRVNDPKTGVLSVAPLGVGTLYRFEWTINPVATSTTGSVISNLLYQFSLAQSSEFRATKVVDGVNHFLVRAYHTNGWQITADHNPGIRAYFDEFAGRENLIAREIEIYEFFSNAVPAAVELELGILEDKAWQHFRSLPSTLSQSNYLVGLAGRVHLFRQRVPVRNVDPEAYQ